MPKLGLALSGGGFRATLYHLGVVRFLKDSGALQDVTDIASVSGGSILAAHLVLNWDRYNGDDASFAAASNEVVKFAQFDLRNRIVRRLPLQFPLRLLAKLRFLNGRNHTPDAILEQYYKKYLYGDRCLYELPSSPTLHMLATNVSTGALSVFNRNGLYVQHRGDGGGQSPEPIPGQMATIARVVAASSAFPGFFPPVEMTAADLGVRDGQFPTEYFTDGGVFDNLGLRAFLWLKQQGSHFDQVLVSDAGKPFQILSDAALGVFGQSVRATDILGTASGNWNAITSAKRRDLCSFRSPSPSSCRRTLRHNIPSFKPRCSRSEPIWTVSPNLKSIRWHSTAMKSLENCAGRTRSLANVRCPTRHPGLRSRLLSHQRKRLKETGHQDRRRRHGGLANCAGRASGAFGRRFWIGMIGPVISI